MPTGTLVDTHCHLDFDEFNHDRDRVVHRATSNGVHQIIVPGVSRATWARLISCVGQYSQCHYALGMHPLFLSQHRRADLPKLETQLHTGDALAVGEIGLDYYQKELDRQRQLELFERQLSIAKRHSLPAIIHCRKAHDDCIRYLRRQEVKGGIIHAFNGSLQQAHHYIELGFLLGFGGMLTYSRSNKLRRLAKQLPLSSIVLETDAPDMTVMQHRGQRNSPEYIPYVMEALASVRGCTSSEITENTTANARRVFPSLGKVCE
ncbi:MAG: TatD family hydrolase [Gammaproteobacteria bacterium]|nr:TatD family hydrolase [Gammaproteobacteria bacterium]